MALKNEHIISGNRVAKILTKADKSADSTVSYYFRDAQGNPIDIVQPKVADDIYSEQHEYNLYGSSRIGTYNITHYISENPLETPIERILGRRQYELTNHLGNVLTTVTDQKYNTTNAGYQPVVTTVTDYYPFGMPMPGRILSLETANNIGDTTIVQLYRTGFETAPYSKPYTAAPAYKNAHLSNGSWTNNRTDTIWTTYGGISNNGKALGLPSTSVNPSTITFTVQIDSGYAMNVKSFSFYDRSSNTGFKNWSMTINGIAVGADTTFVDCSGCSGAVRPTGTITVANPVNVTGTATFVLTLSNKGTGSSGTFRIDSFIVNGNINPIYDITGNSVYANKIYRYSFNGQERETEINQSITSAEFWMYDGRLGRRWNIDPLSYEYAWQSPYVAFNNNPLRYSDYLGLEGDDKIVAPAGHKEYKGFGGNPLYLPSSAIPEIYQSDGSAGFKNGSDAKINYTKGTVRSFSINNDRYVSIFNTKTGAFLGYRNTKTKAYYKSPKGMQTTGTIAKVGFGETRGMYPSKDGVQVNGNTANWDYKSSQELMSARAAIEVVAQRNAAVHPGATPSTDKNNIEYQQRQYAVSENFPAVDPAIANDPTVTNFYNASSPDFIPGNNFVNQKYWDIKIVKSYGPFYNASSSGDTQQGESIYVNFYSVTPKTKKK